MVLSIMSARQMIARARTRCGKDIGDLIDALIKGEPYQTGAGAPTLTPRAIGERYFDSTNSVFYRATGLLTTSWVADARPSSARLLAAGATKTLVAADDGKTILLDTAAGSIVTLPAALGTGNRFRFQVSVKATSNSHIVKVANGTDIIQGLIFAFSDNAAQAAIAWQAGASDDTITLNRSTTGSVTVGEFIEIEDVAAGVFVVHGFVAQTGTEATPFSATV
jgi:hypothetical protein